MTDSQKRVAAAIRAIEAGEIVVVTDDDGRENEGDLIIAAVHCTPEKMAFIVRHTSGIVCTPMPGSEARRLNLAPMVADNDAPHQTAFTVSVDYRHGTSTGISADDRTATVRNLANPNAGAADFVRPGHIFPLVAREGGVLMRSGHTEAAVDLCRLADLPPVGVICELVRDDGAVMRGPDVTGFAAAHGLKLVSVADLIAYRQQKETLVELVESTPVVTPAGPAVAHVFRVPWEPMHHVAIVFGDIRDGHDIPVRLHREDVLRDVFGTGNGLRPVMERIVAAGRGIIVHLREGSVGVAAGPSGNGGRESHQEVHERDRHWREVGLGAQILRSLQVRSIRLLASRERHYVGLEGFGLEITATERLEA